jgi:hypothetical protein
MNMTWNKNQRERFKLTICNESFNVSAIKYMGNTTTIGIQLNGKLWEK